VKEAGLLTSQNKFLILSPSCDDTRNTTQFPATRCTSQFNHSQSLHSLGPPNYLLLYVKQVTGDFAIPSPPHYVTDFLLPARSVTDVVLLSAVRVPKQLLL
jgi:hypothetical protein